MTNKNTKTVYEFYSSELADSKSLKGKNVCLLALGNFKYIAECKKYAKTVLALEDLRDSPFVGFDFKDINSLKETIENWLKTHCMKKFDLIVMNPPYDGSLHLKILESVIPYAEKTVNISPARWLIDPLAKYKNNSDLKKYEQSIAKHIVDIDLYDGNVVFDVAIGQVAVSEIDTYIVSNAYKAMNTTSSFIDKIVQKCKVSKTFKDIATPEGYRGETKNFVGIINSHFGDCTRWISDDYELFCEVRETNTNMDIFFDTEEERKNCFSFLTLKFMRCYAIAIRLNQRVPWQFVPFLDFRKAWTNEDLCSCFNITGYIDDNTAEPGSEWEMILNAMKNNKYFYNR